MSKARPVIPGQISLVTRRCAGRRFLLVPLRDITEVFGYALGYAAGKFGVKIHAVCVLSNHYHLVLTDCLGLLPEFMHWLNGTLARCLNRYHDREENFWAPPPYSRVDLGESNDIVSKMVYTLANPVSAKLVSSRSEWPGLKSGLLGGGPQRLRFKRPRHFFDEEGDLPAEVVLVIERPQGLDDLDDKEFGARLHRLVLKKEKEVQRQLEAEGREFTGVKQVLAQSPESSPRTREPRRGLNPTVASRDKWRRIEMLQERAQFLAEYAAALERFVAGERDVIFPAGTYLMRRRYGVRCHDPP